MAEDLITIEIAYGEPSLQKIITLTARPSITAQQAFDRSGLQHFFPHLSKSQLSFGIFSKSCTPDTILKDGDRLEIYRPLLADPKTMRRQRAKK